MGLAEVVVCIGLLTLLSGLVFFIFDIGSTAWRQTDVGSQIRKQAAVVVGDITRQAERSAFSSLSLDGEAVSFLTALDNSGQIELGPDGKLLWKAYLIYYRDSAEGLVLKTRHDLTTALMAPVPIEDYDDGSGTKPLSDYLFNGRRLAQDVELFQPTSSADQRLEIEIKLSRLGTRNRVPAEFTLASSVLFRN